MRFNANAARNILLFIENNLGYENTNSQIPNQHKIMKSSEILLDPYFSEQDIGELSYAFEVLLEGGYILTVPPIMFDRRYNLQSADVSGLTAKGHELLDNIRDDDVWNDVLKIASDTTGGASLSSLAACSKKIVEARIVGEYSHW